VDARHRQSLCGENRGQKLEWLAQKHGDLNSFEMEPSFLGNTGCDLFLRNILGFQS
jgi:hypothetical protein